MNFNNLWKIFHFDKLLNMLLLYIMETLKTGYILSSTPPIAETGTTKLSHDFLNQLCTFGVGGFTECRQIKWGAGLKCTAGLIYGYNIFSMVLC